MNTDKLPLSEGTAPTIHEQAIDELQSLTLNLYTPINRDVWERCRAVAAKVLNDVFGLVEVSD